MFDSPSKALTVLATEQAHQVLPPKSKMPNTDRARLPTTYKDAKRALEACVSVDEAAQWADKAAALASYAKQAQDVELQTMATRIRARAIRRCGTLLKAVPGQRGGDRRSKGRRSPDGRKAVARAAGLSPHKARQAVRVANVDDHLFTKLVDSSKPPTVDKLAKLGTKESPVSGKQQALKAASRVVTTVHAFVRDINGIDLIAAAHALSAEQANSLGGFVKQAQDQLRRISQLMRPKAKVASAA
jgi:hypothetical protein